MGTAGQESNLKKGWKLAVMCGIFSGRDVSDERRKTDDEALRAGRRSCMSPLPLGVATAGGAQSNVPASAYLSGKRERFTLKADFSLNR